MLAALLSGCAGLNQFPDRPKDYAKALKTLDGEYAMALAEVRKTGNADEKKAIRNHFIERRLAVIDEKFREFETRLAKEGVRADFGIALVGVGVGGAGALVSETTSQILSAVSGGLAGAQAAYSSCVESSGVGTLMPRSSSHSLVHLLVLSRTPVLGIALTAFSAMLITWSEPS